MIAQELANIVKALEILFANKSSLIIRNWEDLFWDLLGFKNKSYKLLLKNNLQLLIRATYDKWPVHDTIVRDNYLLKDVRKEKIRTIIDLGSHIGSFSVFAHYLFPEAIIYAFEPDPKTFKVLQKNIQINHLRNQIIAFPWACAEKNTLQNLYLNTKMGGASLSIPSSSVTRVKTITLNSIFSQNKIKCCNLLKIDVEGAEYDILYNLPKKFFNKIERLCLEYHNRKKPKNANGESLIKFLQSLGFVVKHQKSSGKYLGMLIATRI